MAAKIELLDCTLRDGGHVNNWQFGNARISRILENLNKARVDFIEMGFLRDTDYSNDRSLFSSIEQANKFLDNKEVSSNFSLMIRPDWISFDYLPQAKKINTLRWAFYEKDFPLLIKQVEIAKNAGYSIYLNPINVFAYSEDSLKNLLLTLNDLEPDGVSIVDTFGSLLPSDLTRYLSLFTDNLQAKIKLGLHLHENLSLSFALAIQFIREIGSSRDIVIDSSLLGMGRAPGNLPTELIMPFLNNESNKCYNFNSILKTIDEEIKPLKKIFRWGYSPEYAITAFNRIHRSYAEYLTVDLAASLEDVSQVTESVIAEHLENSFDAQFAKHSLEKSNG